MKINKTLILGVAGLGAMMYFFSKPKVEAPAPAAPATNGLSGHKRKRKTSKRKK